MKVARNPRWRKPSCSRGCEYVGSPYHSRKGSVDVYRCVCQPNEQLNVRRTHYSGTMINLTDLIEMVHAMNDPELRAAVEFYHQSLTKG